MVRDCQPQPLLVIKITTSNKLSAIMNFSANFQAGLVSFQAGFVSFQAGFVSFQAGLVNFIA